MQNQLAHLNYTSTTMSSNSAR